MSNAYEKLQVFNYLTMEKYFLKGASSARPQDGYVFVKAPEKLNSSRLNKFMFEIHVIGSSGGITFLNRPPLSIWEL